ncbi:MAG: hypothetical protein WC076_07990 [Terrimicrobiaceae bacterium]|jgi:hypothetical protein|nr:hypothetical protein [Terrimicrobiaceae bacterium]
MSAPEQADDSILTREAILRALASLSDELGKQGVVGELCLFGGTVMILAFTARLGGTTGESSDVADIVFLIRHLRLESAAATLQIVAQYYPANRIPVRTQYLVEGLFEEGRI